MFEKVVNKITFKRMINRLGQFIRSLGISVLAFENSIGTRSTIAKAMKNNGNIGSNWLAKIAEIYPELNINWLLTGQGEMYYQTKQFNGFNRDPFCDIDTKYTPWEIKTIRDSRNMTKMEFGAMLGVGERIVLKWEKGEREISKTCNRLLKLIIHVEKLENRTTERSVSKEKMTIEEIKNLVRTKKLTAYEISKDVPLTEAGILKFLNGMSTPRESTVAIISSYLKEKYSNTSFDNDKLIELEKRIGVLENKLDID